MKELIAKYKYKILLVCILITISAMCMLYQPTIMANIINALNEVDEFGNVSPDQASINSNGLILVLLGFTNLIAGVSAAVIAAIVAQHLGADIRKQGFKKIQNFGFEDIESFKASSLVVRLTNDVTQIQNFLAMGLTLIARVPVMFIGGFILSIYSFHQLWWVVLIFIVVVIIIVAVAFSSMRKYFMKMQKDLDGVNSILKENMLGVRVVKSFVQEEKEDKRFKNKVNDLTDNYLITATIFSAVIPLFMFTANILTALAVYLTGYLAIDDVTLVGSLVSFISYLMIIMFAIILAGMFVMTLSRASVSFKRLNEIFKRETSISYGKKDFKTIESIEFKNVDFLYPDSEENDDLDGVLKDVSFKINKGEKIGVVGLTGSGKSTLVNLIPRLYNPTRGHIFLNGEDISSYKQKPLREEISYVLQKPVLFAGTIKQNITNGKKADEKTLIKASKAAQAYEFIKKKDKQFNSEVLQKGNNFSGGQKQRISIARGLYQNPELLILDDSTSALDARSERLVKEAIYKLKDITLIMVAQKISSVVDCDRIIVLDEGKIDAIGTHNELVQKSKVYKQIYKTQKGKED